MSNPQTVKRAAQRIDALAKKTDEKKIIISTDLPPREIARKVGDGDISHPSTRHISVTAHGTEVLIGRSTVHPAGSKLPSYSVTAQKIDDEFTTWLHAMNRRNRVSVVFALIMSALLFNLTFSGGSVLATVLYAVAAVAFATVFLFGTYTLVKRKLDADRKTSGVSVHQTSALTEPRVVERPTKNSDESAA